MSPWRKARWEPFAAARNASKPGRGIIDHCFYPSVRTFSRKGFEMTCNETKCKRKNYKRSLRVWRWENESSHGGVPWTWVWLFNLALPWFRQLISVAWAQALLPLTYLVTWHFWQDLYSGNIDLKTWVCPGSSGTSSVRSLSPSPGRWKPWLINA